MEFVGVVRMAVRDGSETPLHLPVWQNGFAGLAIVCGVADGEPVDFDGVMHERAQS
jgi:hypothetical protein